MILLVASLLATMLQAPIPAQRSSPDVSPQARGILTAIVAGDFATVEKQFTDDMKAALPPGALAAMWAKLLNQAGPYRSCGVVLVHGSGPNDRDETVGANKPFKDLATGLASRGIAVLRYDKRTMVHGAKVAALKDFTVRQEVIEDVLEAVKALRAQPVIDPNRVFVLGHSLGGMLIPRIGTADPTIAGLIVIAGAARPLEEAIVAQTRYLTMVDGTISTEEQQVIRDIAIWIMTSR